MFLLFRSECFPEFFLCFTFVLGVEILLQFVLHTCHVAFIQKLIVQIDHKLRFVELAVLMILEEEGNRRKNRKARHYRFSIGIWILMLQI